MKHAQQRTGKSKEMKQSETIPLHHAEALGIYYFIAYSGESTSMFFVISGHHFQQKEAHLILRENCCRVNINIAMKPSREKFWIIHRTPQNLVPIKLVSKMDGGFYLGNYPTKLAICFPQQMMVWIAEGIHVFGCCSARR